MGKSKGSIFLTKLKKNKNRIKKIKIHPKTNLRNNNKMVEWIPTDTNIIAEGVFGSPIPTIIHDHDTHNIIVEIEKVLGLYPCIS